MADKDLEPGGFWGVAGALIGLGALYLYVKSLAPVSKEEQRAPAAVTPKPEFGAGQKALSLLAILVIGASGTFLITNFSNEKVYETLLLIFASGVVVALIAELFTKEFAISRIARALWLTAAALLLTSATFLFSVRLPETRTDEMSGIALFSSQRTGTALYKDFRFPHEFYWRQWKFGILLNAYYDQHPDGVLGADFHRAWIVRAVTNSLSHEYTSHWLVHHQKIMGMGEMWGPEDRSVGTIYKNWSEVPFLAGDAFKQVKMPVVYDRISIPPGGFLGAAIVDERTFRILISGKYIRTEIDIVFDGSPLANHSPYPTWIVPEKAFSKTKMDAVYYVIRYKSYFPRFHWNLTSEDIQREALWSDRMLALLKRRFDDEAFFRDLSEKIMIRSAADAVSRGRSIKSVDDPILFNEVGM